MDKFSSFFFVPHSVDTGARIHNGGQGLGLEQRKRALATCTQHHSRRILYWWLPLPSHCCTLHTHTRRGSALARYNGFNTLKTETNGRERDGLRERRAMAWLPTHAGFSRAHTTPREEGFRLPAPSLPTLSLSLEPNSAQRTTRINRTLEKTKRKITKIHIHNSITIITR